MTKTLGCRLRLVAAPTVATVTAGLVVGTLPALAGDDTTCDGNLTTRENLVIRTTSSAGPRRLLRRGRLAVAASVAALAAAPSSALAGFTNYYFANVGAGAKQVDITRTNLNTSVSWVQEANRTARAGAHYPGGYTLYGSYAVGNPDFACRTYGGLNLGAMVYNAHSVPVLTYAFATYGSDSHC